MWIIVITAGNGHTEFYGPYKEGPRHSVRGDRSKLAKDLERLITRREQLGKSKRDVNIIIRKVHTLHTLEQALNI